MRGQQSSVLGAGLANRERAGNRNPGVPRVRLTLSRGTIGVLGLRRVWLCTDVREQSVLSSRGWPLDTRDMCLSVPSWVWQSLEASGLCNVPQVGDLWHLLFIYRCFLRCVGR